MAMPATTPRTSGVRPVRRFPYLTAAFLAAVLVGGAVYGKLTATQRGEHFNIARALSSGQGFAHPFGDRTGPTAWMGPVYPAFLAALYRLGGGDRNVVTTALVLCHVGVLVATGVLVLALARQTTRRLGPVLVATAFFLGALYQFPCWFQHVDDCWVILLTLDLLLVGLCWLRPLDQWPRAAAWGLLGGLAALTNPIVGFTWGVLSLALGVRRRAWSRLAVAGLVAGLTLAPWTVRNYLVLGRLIPVKSNLAFEMYQSQCLEPDGLLQNFHSHPAGGGREGHEYRKAGEIAFMDHKWQQFREAVAADPPDFFDRVASRLLGATLWYVPFNRADEAKQPWVVWARRCAHPLPLLALLLLAFTAPRQPLAPPQWAALGIYLGYLLPYVATSYYDRYAAPLLVVKVLLVVWAADRLLTWRLPAPKPGPSIP
jgi:hypothetical protein